MKGLWLILSLVFILLFILIIILSQVKQPELLLSFQEQKDSSNSETILEAELLDVVEEFEKEFG